MPARTKIILKPGKEQSIRRFHPWVFSGAINRVVGVEPAEGDLVDIYSDHDEFLAAGHYAGGSIAVRIISFKQMESLEDLIAERVKLAWKYRHEIGLADNSETNVFRLINAEGDNLPGLVVDYYNGTIVTQFHSFGMYKVRDLIFDKLKEVLAGRVTAIYDKSGSTLPYDTRGGVKDGYVLEGETADHIIEYGNKFIIDWKEGQKTGFFIDQRENRKLMETLSSGRSVLNLFGYTGGFSVYALKGRAKLVHTVDSSAGAADLAVQNVRLNFGDQASHEVYVEDVSTFLQNNRDRYDMIIADPPAFAKHQNVLQNALQGYKSLNSRVFELIDPGGIVFTFSCSQVVNRENFRKSVFVAAANAGRKVRIMFQLSQPADHPVSIYHPEGEYLKGLVLYVE